MSLEPLGLVYLRYYSCSSPGSGGLRYLSLTVGDGGRETPSTGGGTYENRCEATNYLGVRTLLQST